MKLKRDEEKRKVDAMTARIKPHLPEGWYATECAFISMSSLQISPSLVSVQRETKTLKAMLQGKDRTQAQAIRKQWMGENRAKAAEILSALASNGINARQDGGTLYVRV